MIELFELLDQVDHVLGTECVLFEIVSVIMERKFVKIRTTLDHIRTILSNCNKALKSV